MERKIIDTGKRGQREVEFLKSWGGGSDYGGEPGERVAVKRKEVRYSDIAPLVASGIARFVDPEDGGSKTFGDFLVAVARASAGSGDRQTAIKELMAVYNTRYENVDARTKAALSETSGATGGWLTPEEFRTQIAVVGAEASIFRSNGAQLAPMRSSTLKLPMLDLEAAHSAGSSAFTGGVSFGWNGEGLTLPETEPLFNQLALKMGVLGGFAINSNALLADSEALGRCTATVFGQAIAWFEDYAYLNGTGAGEPEGIVSSSASVTVTRAYANQINYQDVLAMESAVLPACWNNALFVTNPTTLPQLRQLRDSLSQSVMVSSMKANGRPQHLLGDFPLLVTEKLPTLGTKGDLALIDPRFYVIGDHQSGLLIDFSDEASQTTFVRGQSVYRVCKRGDGRPWFTKPVTLADGVTQASPFVVLK